MTILHRTRNHNQKTGTESEHEEIKSPCDNSKPHTDDTPTEVPPTDEFQQTTSSETGSEVKNSPYKSPPPVRRSSRRTKSNQNYKDPTRTGWSSKDTNMVEAFNFNVHCDYEVYAAHQYGDVRATSIYTPKDYHQKGDFGGSSHTCVTLVTTICSFWTYICVKHTSLLYIHM